MYHFATDYVVVKISKEYNMKSERIFFLISGYTYLNPWIFLSVLLIDIFISMLKLPQDHVSTLSKLQYVANEQACQIIFKRILNPSALIFDHLLSFVLFALLPQLLLKCY